MPDGEISANGFDSVSFLHLRYFLAVAEHGSVTAAADALMVAQPSLSQQLKRLEMRCGVILFHRTTTGMSLTSAGCALRDLAVGGIAVLRTLPGRSAEPVVVGVPRGVHSAVLDAVHTALGDNVAVSFRPADSVTHDALLSTGALDAAIARGPRPSPGHSERLLSRHAMHVVLADRHPLAGRDRLRWTDLRDDELLWFDTGRAPRHSAAMINALGERGWRPKLHIVDTSSDAVFRDALVRGGRVVALRPFDGGEPPPDLVAVPIDDPVFEEFYLVTQAAALGTGMNGRRYRPAQR